MRWWRRWRHCRMGRHDYRADGVDERDWPPRSIIVLRCVDCPATTSFFLEGRRDG